jgi:hypothetical protein
VTVFGARPIRLGQPGFFADVFVNVPSDGDVS